MSCIHLHYCLKTINHYHNRCRKKRLLINLQQDNEITILFPQELFALTNYQCRLFQTKTMGNFASVYLAVTVVVNNFDNSSAPVVYTLINNSLDFLVIRLQLFLGICNILATILINVSIASDNYCIVQSLCFTVIKINFRIFQFLQDMWLCVSLRS